MMEQKRLSETPYLVYSINYKPTDGLFAARRLETQGLVRISFVRVDEDIHDGLHQRWGVYRVTPQEAPDHD